MYCLSHCHPDNSSGMRCSEFSHLPDADNARLHALPLLKLGLCQLKEWVLGIKQVAIWNW
jgi:hypothetical protein